jgi:regulator of protease activity HflC (stomatin/prohibitin superfamily)
MNVVMIFIFLMGLIVAATTPIMWKAMEFDGPTPKAAIAIPLCVSAVALVFTCFYAQNAGEVIVRINLGGSLAGYSEDAGFHAKAPWQSTVSYDVRNNLVNLYRDAEYKYDGGAAEGSCVTVNDKGGASADIDLQVVYSLDGDSAMKLYEDYGTQQAFTEKVILNDVRAVAREVAGQYDTITLLTNRGEFTKGLREALSGRWSGLGLNVEQVSVQDVRYPESITSRYADAQAAEVAKAQALNEQETAKVEAETKVINAKGAADANRVLTESLTQEVIQQHYIDALTQIGSSGNLVVVPEGSQPIVGTK